MQHQQFAQSFYYTNCRNRNSQTKLTYSYDFLRNAQVQCHIQGSQHHHSISIFESLTRLPWGGNVAPIICQTIGLQRPGTLRWMIWGFRTLMIVLWYFQAGCPPRLSSLGSEIVGFNDSQKAWLVRSEIHILSRIKSSLPIPMIPRSFMSEMEVVAAKNWPEPT